MQLVYLSPVPWESFAQRPHKFVEWFHARTQGRVLWVDPYPTRLPILSDLRRRKMHSTAPATPQTPDWLTLLKPGGLPIEPLPFSYWINRFAWQRVSAEIQKFAQTAPSFLAIGKPSLLAISLLEQPHWQGSLYDAMDDFPAFYGGISRFAMASRERRIVRSVSTLWASSTALKNRWGNLRDDIQLVRNGLDGQVLPEPSTTKPLSPKHIFGYVGTIASWFDWDWVNALAKARPNDTLRLIGPVYAPAPYKLAGNIEILPACNHQSALKAMQEFSVGLIPFQKNSLTASVDPIKYYEYRALNLPVISSDFGEMSLRKDAPGVFVSKGAGDISSKAAAALEFIGTPHETTHFIDRHSWNARFDAARFITISA
ncbi:conserved hypothetical protein [gamma proteobacterium HdN1]|nr:conserved hypothetical protein [gamma proteobacterium HdN1]